MRSEAVGARTWLLLAGAAWAVLTFLLALGGMGGRITPLPDDATLTQPLPPLPPRSAERLGSLAQYSEILRRPVFASDRQPHPFFIEGQAGEPAEKNFDYLLTSVLITPRVQLAILQSPGRDGPASAVRVKLGEAPSDASAWHLIELEPRRAVFEGPEGQRTLELRIFDGQGGQAPTHLASNTPTQGQTSPRGSAPANPPPSDGIAPVRAPPSPTDPQGRPAANASAANPTPPQTTEQQMQAIRERIEARRRQMREQPSSAAPATTN